MLLTLQNKYYYFFTQYSTYLLTYSLEQSPSWEPNQFSASQEIPCNLWNPKVHYHIPKCPPPVPILSPINRVYALTPHFLNIHLHITIPSMPGSSKWSFSLGFPTKTLNTPLPSPISCMPHTSHSCRFGHPNNFWWGVLIIQILLM